MVKVKDFCGAVFSPNDYQIFLHSNIQHLENIPMSKTFDTAQMIASGRLCPESQPFFYIYRQIYLGHTSFGILAEISLQDYQSNKIKRHEKTLHRPNMTHQTYIEKHVGPVVVSHREDQELDLMIQALAQQKQPYSIWTTVDGRQHSLWKIKKSQYDVTQKFNKIEAFYILDGHHRLEAASQNYLLSSKMNETDLWIQAIIYSSEYIMIHPQHRVLLNIPQNVEIINQLLNMDHLQITELTFTDLKEINIKEELCRSEVVLKLYEKLYGINFKKGSRNILQKVPSFRLQNQIFTSFLDQEMLKLKYVPGIIEQEKINKHDIVFFVRQPEIETIFQIADESVTMPPKSTWIEPKPCSHMVIRLLN